MNDPLPLPFEHGYDDTQLRWHWKTFKEHGYSLIGQSVENPEDAQAWWEVYMLGAVAESHRGQ